MNLPKWLRFNKDTPVKPHSNTWDDILNNTQTNCGHPECEQLHKLALNCVAFFKANNIGVRDGLGLITLLGGYAAESMFNTSNGTTNVSIAKINPNTGETDIMSNLPSELKDTLAKSLKKLAENMNTSDKGDDKSFPKPLPGTKGGNA